MQKSTFLLHPAQQDVYIDQLLHVESPHYNIGGYIKLKGPLHKEKFHEAVNSGPKIFDVFKSRFDVNEPEIIGYLDHNYERLEMGELNFSDHEDPEKEAECWMQSRFNFPFVMQKGNLLFEHYLIKIDENEHWFFGRYHHLITDGYGFIVWVQYVARKYKSLLAGDNFQFNYPSYLNEAIKASGYSNTAEYEKEGRYWKDKINEKPKNFLQKKYQQNISGKKSTTYILNLSMDQRKLLEEVQDKTQSGLQQLTIGALLIYFGKASNQSEFIFGIPIHKRGSKPLRSIVGMFSGVLPYKGSFQKDLKLTDFLRGISHSIKKDYRHQNYLIGDLSRHLQIISSENYLYEILVHYELLNFELNFGEEIQAALYQLSNEYERNPLQFCWQDFGNHQPLQLQIQFQNEYFCQEEIELLALRIIFIVEQFANGLDKNIGSFDILPSGERRLLERFNGTLVGFCKDKTMIDLFEKQVADSPEKTAVVFEDEQLTYKEINKRSNQLAHYLRSRGIKEDTLVPICIERSVEMIVGILGTLKAGGAYTPIDPAYPEERIGFIVEETGARIALSSKACKSKIQAVAGLNIIELDGEWGDIRMQPEENPEIAVRPHHLAYVIYTSGSTGKPKGVMIEHRSVVNLINAQSRFFNISGDERILQFSNYCFDASVEQMFLALFNGASLILFPEGLQFDIDHFEKFLKEKKISHLHATPYFLENVKADNDEFLQRVISGGDVCKKGLANHWKNKVNFYNEYGPTETTVTAIEYHAGYNKPEKTISLPIGKPVTNTQVYILDKNDTFCPIGVFGELHIGGVQVARGYLNRPDLTLEKFITNPFGTEPEARMYKTGDLARWLPDGNIEYLGRVDEQVKIRGYRIELEEIEIVLRESELVNQTVVLAKEDKDGYRRLVGYVVSKGLFSREMIISYLKGKLPEYMIPALWVELEELPLTSNGKIDKKSLPDPDEDILSNNMYEAPGNELETKLAEIWQEIFQVKRVGIHDNFFELGGHSLKAIQLISRLHKLYNIKTDIGKIFSYPTIRQLSRVLGAEKLNQFIEIKRLPEQDHYELSHAQKRLWVLSHYKDGSIAYNVPGAYIMEGNLQVAAFKLALNMIIERHENLRTVFIEVDGEPRQKILPFSLLGFGIDEIDLRGNSDAGKIINKWIEDDASQAFDLSKGPLLRATLFREASEKHVLVFNIHHIISDGWSKGIIIKELFHLYKVYVSGVENKLKPLPIRYIDYSAWHAASSASQGKYWRELYAEDIPLLNFPVDFERPKVLSFFGAVLHIPVSETLTQDLRAMATRHNMTLNNLFLALYGLLVCQHSKQEEVVIGSLVSGRSHVDLESLVGVFINFLPVKLAPKEQLLLTEYLNNSYDTLVQAYCNQDYPFDLMVEDSIKHRDISRNPFFDTMVNFHWENDMQDMVQLGEHQISEIGITVKPFPAVKEDFFQSVLDFKLDIEPRGSELDLHLSYNSKLFTRERMNAFLSQFVEMLAMAVKEPDKYLTEYFKLTHTNLTNEKAGSSLSNLPVNICASFTIEPLQEYLEYWNNEFELNIKLNFAPYNQVFQQLLNPDSLLNKNKGINVLFIRMEDWLRDQIHQSTVEQVDFINRTYQELIKAIEHARKITVVPFLIGIVPLMSSYSLATEVAARLTEAVRNLESSLKNIAWFHLLDLGEIATLYDVDEIFDVRSDEIGHMPFTQEYYAALATFLARKIRAYKGPAYKVIALDCDNTLWKGVCGEVGALSVVIDDNYSYLQEFLLKKYKEGFLLVLCSKNNEDDVWEVFDRHPQMKIKREHIAAHRINWQSKTDNLLAIAKELNLSPDSFIFLDDSEFEVEQITLICPEVLSIALPEDPGSFFSFLNHIWAFDHFQVTEEDGQRNIMYKAEKNRKEEQVKYSTLNNFLQSLNLQVTIGSLQEKELERAVQLTQRTNQFNLNGVRRTHEEFAKTIHKQNTLNWIIRAKDRFGDYGIVGLLIARETEDTLVLESFLLSCRILGRNVEDFVLSELRNHCIIHGLHTITAMFHHTGKNKPFIEFLSHTGWVADIQANTYSILINNSDKELSRTTNEKQAI